MLDPFGLVELNGLLIISVGLSCPVKGANERVPETVRPRSVQVASWC